MARILVVDDDPHIRDVIRFALEQAHHEVREASNGQQALDLLTTFPADLVILDVMMPELDGMETCRRVRATSAVPILMLSSKDDEFDRVLGLELGADDFISKPFSPRELVARVKANLRRVSLDSPAETPPSALLKHGRVTLDPEAFETRIDQTLIDLTPTEFAVLRTLLGRPRKVFSRDELMRHAYDVLTIVSDRTIDSHIRHIREKFSPHGCAPIETVHGIGYRAGACA